MKQKAEEIQKEVSDRTVKFKFIIADFGNLKSITEYRTLLEPNTKDLDIGVVICNAGISQNPGFLHWSEDKTFENEINVNTLHATYVAKVMGDQLLKRSRRSALIVTASIAECYPLACYTLIYCCTKKFASWLA